MANTDPEPIGLRERKRRATENAIEMAAVTLAGEFGLDAVTVEAICERADVSRSTFFNYFPSKDSAIFGRPMVLPPIEESRAVLDHFATEPYLGIFALSQLNVGHSFVNTEVARLRHALAQSDPRIVHATIQASSALRMQATDLIAEWLLGRPGNEKLDSNSIQRKATLIVGISEAAISVLIQQWYRMDGDVQMDLEDFRSAVRELRELAATGE